MYWFVSGYVAKDRREKVCQEMQIEMPHTTQEDILQRLVRRYLFKLERMKEEGLCDAKHGCNASQDEWRSVEVSVVLRKVAHVFELQFGKRVP